VGEEGTQWVIVGDARVWNSRNHNMNNDAEGLASLWWCGVIPPRNVRTSWMTWKRASRYP
jgi:hypothetical protein